MMTCIPDDGASHAPGRSEKYRMCDAERVWVPREPFVPSAPGGGGGRTEFAFGSNEHCWSHALCASSMHRRTVQGVPLIAGLPDEDQDRCWSVLCSYWVLGVGIPVPQQFQLAASVGSHPGSVLWVRSAQNLGKGPFRVDHGEGKAELEGSNGSLDSSSEGKVMHSYKMVYQFSLTTFTHQAACLYRWQRQSI